MTCLFSFFLVSRLILQSKILNEELGINHKSILRNHVLVTILIAAFFVIFNQLGPVFPEDNINQNNSHDEHQTLNNLNH